MKNSTVLKVHLHILAYVYATYLANFHWNIEQKTGRLITLVKNSTVSKAHIAIPWLKTFFSSKPSSRESWDGAMKRRLLRIHPGLSERIYVNKKGGWEREVFFCENGLIRVYRTKRSDEALAVGSIASQDSCFTASHSTINRVRG